MAKQVKAKQTAALKNVLKKLSALRHTLRKDERAVLDQFILGASAEVAGHRYGADLPAKTLGAKTLGAKTLGAKTLGAKTLGAKTLGAVAEVSGHRYGADLPAKTLGAKTIGAKVLGAQIVFNAQTQSYQVID